ncbi:hypothetical protein [Microbacterium sp. cf332]|uniref:hypothetical protein n=1 Tax=Microbacterium sp. cf332 TaxID=1761804 RepID=UPI0008872823|nr:hypothetical protein [Microbacterium sp. cf332]SDQ50344.1 hypothetical protein SAMN04487847_1645 [Microbacterium sp. cf332]
MTHARWSALLDGLEADVARDPASTDVDAGAGAWHPPVDLGPLPADLADRARALVGAQAARARRLSAELDAHRAHLAALARIPQTRPDAAVYLDLDG